MKSFFLYGPEDVRPIHLEDPEPSPGEMIVMSRFTGICGSDIHYFKSGYCGRFVPNRPFALGHECSGIVNAIGAEVTGFSVGDPVAIDPSMPCGNCRYCLEGRYNLCANMRYLGSASCDPHINGSLAGKIRIPASNCYHLPDGISLSQAALLEPLSVALHAVRQAGQIAGRSVLITGGGPIGQLILRVVQAFAATRVVMSDVSSYARAFAVSSGADLSVDPLDNHAWTHVAPFDIVIEASGSPTALSDGIKMTRPGGTLVLVGTLPEEVKLPANLIMNRELTLKGSFRFAHVFEEAMNLVARGIISLDGIVTQTFHFEDTPQALQLAMGRSNVMKILIEHPSS
jgi:L-idonate 5-dehydrogenase